MLNLKKVLRIQPNHRSNWLLVIRERFVALVRVENITVLSTIEFAIQYKATKAMVYLSSAHRRNETQNPASPKVIWDESKTKTCKISFHADEKAAGRRIRFDLQGNLKLQKSTGKSRKHENESRKIKEVGSASASVMNAVGEQQINSFLKRSEIRNEIMIA
jgi:hypothetical protein